MDLQLEGEFNKTKKKQKYNKLLLLSDKKYQIIKDEFNYLKKEY